MPNQDPNVAVLSALLNDALNVLPENNAKTRGIYVTRKDLLQVMTSVFSGYVEMLVTVKTEMKEELAEQTTPMKTENVKLRKQLLQTNIELEKLQQYINRDTLKICNVKEPELANDQQENVNETVKKVMEKAGIQCSDADISVAHRLPVSRGSKLKHKSIIIKYKGRDTRNCTIRQKKEKMKENTAFQREYPEAFMCEHLTPLRSKATYELRNDDTIERVWTMDGRIKVLKVGRLLNSKPISITSLADLKLVGWSEEKIEKLVMEK